MAYGDPYATRPELKDYLGIPQSKTASDLMLDSALDSATTEINNHCDRQFNKATAAETRMYPPRTPHRVVVDDMADTSALVVRSGPLHGSLGTAWDSDDYHLEPPNNVVNGTPGWPFNVIVVHNSTRWLHPSCDVVEVTATFGWEAVPAAVKQACLILAAKNYKLSDAPLGVAGFNQSLGIVRVQDDAQATAKLCPYRLNKVLVA